MEKNSTLDSPKDEPLITSLETEKEQKKNIYENYYNESFLNKIFFQWSKRSIQISNKTQLKISDVNSINEKQSAKNVLIPLKEKWDYYSEKSNYKMVKNYPLLFTIFRVHIFQLLELFILDFCLTMIRMSRMFFFRQIIFLFSSGNFNGIENENKNKKPFYQLNIYQYGFLFIINKFIGTIIFHNMNFKDMLLHKRIKIGMTSLLFDKILKENLNSYNGKSDGETINLIEFDCERIGFIFFIIPKVLNTPITILVSLYFLFQLFGFKFTYALSSLIILLASILLLQFQYLKNMRKILQLKDERMKIVSYVFHILRNIKINGWEEEFAKRIKNKREDELSFVRKNLIISLLRMLINSNIPLILLIISIGTYIKSNNTLEIANLFTAFQLINQMTFPLMGIPMFLNEFFSNLISIKRIQNFLKIPEHNYKNNENLELLQKENILIKYENATFSLNHPIRSLTENKKKTKIESFENNTNENIKKTQSLPLKKEILTNITLTIKKGEFIIILGPTGSGKSNLINSFLNNLQLTSSTEPIIINGTISYCPQQPWLIEDTIKNNILLYNKFNNEKYNKIISACQLINDFEVLNKKDDYLINTGGMNLSGGQRIRISLGRCLYKESDIYLLDDPLAAIDTKVGSNIFKDAFVDFLNGKTRVLVTNEVSNLSYADKIILMDKGSIKFYGKYNEFISTFGKNYVVENENENKKLNDIENNKNNNGDKFECETSSTSINNYKKEKEKNDNLNEQNPLLILDKKTKKGKVSLKTYKTFIQLQGGYLILILLLALMIITRIFNSYRSIYITTWTKTQKQIKQQEKEKKPIDINEQLSNFYTYVKISLFGILLNFLIELIYAHIAIFSQRKLHETMVYKFLRAPMNLFHDLVPIGQLLNRLTKDIDLVQRIIRGVSMFCRALFSLIASIYVCYLYCSFTLLLSPLLIFICVYLTIYSIGASRTLQRLERSSYSPIMTILSESIKGVEIIRTANIEENFKDKMYRKINENYGVNLYLEGSRKWYSERLKFSSNFFFGLIITYILFKKEIFSPQAIGLILNNSEDFSNELTNVLNFFSNVEISMVSIERCESAMNTKEEKKPDPKEEIIIKDNEWPSKGKVEFISFSAKYRPFTPIILKKLNLTINPKEKIGIIGRTGSGKSTIVMSICRIIESFEGKILIDDIDISKINLDSLRHNITIVSQDPFILEGTLRDNLDPLKKYNDNEILEILDSFSLFNDINPGEKRLNIKIKEGGSNLSIGEKQLICFARATLKKSKLIILDEATSSMDVHTEEIIQKNMKILFEDCTVIMIAHHIQMVNKCQKIVVLDNGEIVECDSYENLMGNKKSKFYSLYKESLAS